uniref:Protein kinase domain-containing protein n=1 Tax=Ditylum brightwellii TaxID=49249 RepID=A0A7S4VGD3_9STRA
MSLSKQSGNSEHDDETTGITFVNEGPLFRIYHVVDSDQEHSSQTGSVAIKVLNDRFADDKDTSRLENEYSILNHLANRDAAGSAIKKTSHHGSNATTLEWIDGITLKEWIRKFHSTRSLPVAIKSDTDEMKSIIMVMRNIAWSMVDVHDAGISHNNITPEHIIINIDDSASIKFISFGSASFLAENNELSNAGARKDLAALGYIFYEIVSGKSPLRGRVNQTVTITTDCATDMELEPKSTREEEHDGGEMYISAVEVYSALLNKLPFVFVKIVMALIESKMTAERYHSVTEVYLLLDKMMSNPRNFLSDKRKDLYYGQLYFPSYKLYDRDDQLSKIMNTYSQMTSEESSKMILVSGYSGTGKSALIEHARPILKTRNAHIIYGKFDQLQQAEPFFAIIDAFNGYFDKVKKGGPEYIQRIKTAIFEAIGSEVGVLTNFFPRLCQVLGSPVADPVQVDSQQAQNRLKYLFKMMIGAIASPSSPLVLFLDDLQWADSSSLDLIEAVVTDSEIKCILFAGTYRSNEVNNAFPLTRFLADIAEKHISVIKIELENIGREAANDLISDAICKATLDSKMLADIVYRKTSGNVLFLTQFLQSLYAEGLFWFSLDTESWEWDYQGIETKTIPKNVINLLTERIVRLPVLTQHALNLLSCIGCACAESTLILFMNEIGQNNTEKSNDISERENNILLALEIAVAEGLVKKEGSLYVFVHDQIQSAAYSLNPEHQRGPLHLQIGNSILKNVPIGEMENVLFIAVDQLNRGTLSVNREDLKETIAQLNLRAGKKAMALAAFQSSASFFEAGISLLDEYCWDKMYELSLQLYGSYADAQFCIGHFDEVGQVTAVIIKHAKPLWDGLNAYSTLIKALGSQNKLRAAIEITCNILGELGEHIPSVLPDQNATREDLMRSIRLFAMMTDDQFLSLNNISDDKKTMSMKFLSHLAIYCFMAKINYVPFVFNRMLDLTLNYGVSNESCTALAMSSFLISDSDGDSRASYRIGELALLLVEKLEANEYISQVHANVYCARSWNEMRMTTKPLHHAYKRGMEIGDIQNAMLSAQYYCINRFLCGIELPTVEKEFRYFLKQMKEYEQITIHQSTLPFLQAVLNFMGASTNPVELTGEIIAQNTYIEACFDKHLMHVIVKVHVLCGWLAYMFGEYELASSIISRRREIENSMNKKIELYGVANFYDCLTHLALAHKTKDTALTTKISHDIEIMMKLARSAPCSNEHRILLIEAEMAFFTKEIDSAIGKYNAAIAAARVSGFIHEEALCYEKAGDLFLDQGNSRRAAYYYGLASELYCQWGARGKVDHLHRQIPL